MATANDVRRLFLQAVLSRRIVSGKLAQTLWEKCIQAVKAADDSIVIANGRDAWDVFLQDVNTSLNPLDLEFKLVHDETSGKLMYALVNVKGDAIAQLATEYSATEMAFFRAIVEQIMLAPNESYCLTSLGALREVSSLPGKGSMSKTQAEVVLGSFVARGWLLHSRKGRYMLSTRSLLELSGYLKSTYPDAVIECTICMEILTRGMACTTANCKTRLHNHCFLKYRRRNTACPSCAKAWPESRKELVQIGEAAFRPGQENRRRMRKVQAEESEEDNEGDATQHTQSQMQSQTQSQTQSTQSQMDVDDDEDQEDEEEPAPIKGRRKTRR